MRFPAGSTRRLRVGLAVAISAVGVVWAVHAEGQDQATGSVVRPDSRFSLPKPSLDSVIRWSDQHFFHQWRIQQHIESGECRLLDEDGKTQAKGTFEECLAELESIKRQQDLQPMQARRSCSCTVWRLRAGP